MFMEPTRGGVTRNEKTEKLTKGKEETCWNCQNERIRQQMCKTPNYWCRNGIYTDDIGEKRYSC